MINSVKFSERLMKIMDFHALSSSAFADRIGAQRSSISHILSGRNKPSLDFVLKVTQEFPDVDLYWLLNGRGTFPISKPKNKPEKKTSSQTKTNSSSKSTDEIERIVIFYKDGTFKNFKN
ncbi:MAG: helix-turn-helix transcriptional regulator [Flavobacteriaceae bacterium]|nr:helix-turn-helix transcriptional regulator [Flavobacteriaceae bacterium]